MKRNVVKLNERQLRKIVKESIESILNESIKATDPRNVVPQEVAEKFGFKREYVNFGDGLELWGKRLDFNPLEDYRASAKFLSQLGIGRFASESYNGYVRITVRPYPKQNSRPNMPEYI